MLQAAAPHPTICDVTNIKLFPKPYHRTNCHKFLFLFNLASCYVSQSIRINSFLASGDFCHLLITFGSPEVIKLFPCSTLLGKKFILLINVKMPTIIGILTFISMINTSTFISILVFMSIEISCSVELSMKKSFITSGPGVTECQSRSRSKQFDTLRFFLKKVKDLVFKFRVSMVITG